MTAKRVLSPPNDDPSTASSGRPRLDPTTQAVEDMMAEPMTNDEARDEIGVDEDSNEQIYSNANFFPRHLPLDPSAVPFLVTMIVAADPSLNQKYQNYTDATILVNAHEDLEEEIRASWASGNIGKIRSSTWLTGNLLLHGPEQMKATRAAWEVPYVGEHHILLLDIIDEMKKQARPASFYGRARAYSNTAPVVQSSGAGKSRMADEAAKLVFTIPFNLTKDPISGFPHPDQSIRVFLTTGGDCENIQFRYTTFLDNLFRHVESLLDELRLLEKPLAEAWYQHLKTPRPDIGRHETNRTLLYRLVVEATQAELGKTAEPTSVDVQNSAERMEKRATELILRLNRSESARPTKLLLYFDEAHSLITGYSATGGHSLYNILLWAFDYLKDHPLVVIFLSTNSQLARPAAPPKPIHGSDRVVISIPLLQAPITEMPFDCLPDNQPIAKTRELSLDLVSQPEFMVKFGRPLFWARWRGGSELVRDEIVQFAVTKLTREANFYQRYDDRALLAVLSTRVLLELEGSWEDGRHMEQALIEGYMRIAYSAPAHREYIQGGTPSEPILAEAAAQAMTSWSSEDQKRDITRELVRFSENGLIDRGERAGMVARFLLTLAHDQAYLTSISSSSKPLFSTAIPVVDFLKALFSDKWSNRVLDSRPDNHRQGDSLRDAFKHAYVRFTHFVKANDGSAVTTHGASAAVIRGFAFQCFARQEAVDIVIPVVLTSGEQGTSMVGLGEEVMTGILISVKNWGSQIPATDCDIDAEALNFFPSRCEFVRPYIALTMELGVEKATRDPVLATVPPVVRPRRTQTIPQEPPKHPRYSIAVTGGSSEVYGCVHNNETFARLLASRHLLVEHPRRTKDNLDGILRLKPFFAYGTASYDWLDTPELSETPILTPEGVRLGREGVEEVVEEGGGDVTITDS